MHGRSRTRELHERSRTLQETAREAASYRSCEHKPKAVGSCRLVPRKVDTIVKKFRKVFRVTGVASTTVRCLVKGRSVQGWVAHRVPFDRRMNCRACPERLYNSQRIYTTDTKRSTRTSRHTRSILMLHLRHQSRPSPRGEHSEIDTHELESAAVAHVAGRTHTVGDYRGQLFSSGAR